MALSFNLAWVFIASVFTDLVLASSSPVSANLASDQNNGLVYTLTFGNVRTYIFLNITYNDFLVIVLFHCTFMALKSTCPLAHSIAPQEYVMGGERELFSQYVPSLSLHHCSFEPSPFWQSNKFKLCRLSYITLIASTTNLTHPAQYLKITSYKYWPSTMIENTKNSDYKPPTILGLWRAALYGPPLVLTLPYLYFSWSLSLHDIWWKPVTHQVRSPHWLRRHPRDATRCILSDMAQYVFSDSYHPLRSDGQLELEFSKASSQFPPTPDIYKCFWERYKE